MLRSHPALNSHGLPHFCLSKNVFIGLTPTRVWEELLPDVFSLIATWGGVYVHLNYNAWKTRITVKDLVHFI